MRKSSFVLLFVFAAFLNLIALMALSSRLELLHLLHKSMSISDVFIYSALFLFVNLFSVGMTLFNDRSGRIEKAIKEGYEEIKTLPNGNRLLFKKNSEKSYSFREYDTRGYCVDSKYYNNDDLIFTDAIKEMK